MAVTISQVISGVSAFEFVRNTSFTTGTWDTDPATEFEAETEVQVGYLSGPVVMEYSSEQEKIDVEQDTFPIKHLLKAEGVTIKANLAEATLVNIQFGLAAPGSITSGPPATMAIGPVSAGAATSSLAYCSLRIVTTGPTAALPVRRIIVPKAHLTGNVGMTFSKGAIQMIPVEFSVCRAQDADGNLCPAVWIEDKAS